MTSESRENRLEPPVVEFEHPSYQPSKAEMEEPIRSWRDDRRGNTASVSLA